MNEWMTDVNFRHSSAEVSLEKTKKSCNRIRYERSAIQIKENALLQNKF